MTKPPAPGLAARLRDGSATDDERGWARRRVTVLREYGDLGLGLSPAQADELADLSAALEVAA